MRRLRACVVVALCAGVAAWVGCRDDLDVDELSLLAGSDGGTAVTDGAIVIIGSDAPGSGSDGGTIAGSDGGMGSGSDGGVGSGSDGGMGSGSDGGMGSGSDGGVGSGSDGGLGADDAGDGETGAGPDDAGGRRGGSLDNLDQTSFYACAGGGCDTATGAGLGGPIAVAISLAIRRRRRRVA